MSKIVKRIHISILIFIVGLFTVIIYNLYLIDIEDRYGDLQTLYFDSQSGDLVINNMTGETGIIEIENRRMYIKKGNSKVNMDEWLDPNNEFIFNVNVYRTDNSKEYLNMSRKQFDQKRKLEKVTSISHLEIK